MSLLLSIFGQTPGTWPSGVSHDTIIFAVIGGGVTIITLLIKVWWDMRKMQLEQAKVRQTTTEINDAVNHRHLHGEDAPRMLDAVYELLAWKRKWDDLDPGWNNAEALNEEVESMKHRINALEQRVAEQKARAKEG